MNSYDIYQRSAMKMEGTAKNITCSGKIGKTYYEYGENKKEQAAKQYWEAIKGK